MSSLNTMIAVFFLLKYAWGMAATQDSFYSVRLDCSKGHKLDYVSDTSEWPISPCEPSDDLCDRRCRPGGSSRIRVIHSALGYGSEEGPKISAPALWEKTITSLCKASVYPGRVVGFSEGCVSGSSNKFCYSKLSLEDAYTKTFIFDSKAIQCVQSKLFSYHFSPNPSSQVYGLPVWESMSRIEQLSLGAIAIFSTLSLILGAVAAINLTLTRRVVIPSLCDFPHMYYGTFMNKWFEIPLPKRVSKGKANFLADSNSVTVQVTGTYKTNEEFDVCLEYPTPGNYLSSGTKEEGSSPLRTWLRTLTPARRGYLLV